jgi:hypothetical protein
VLAHAITLRDCFAFVLGLLFGLAAAQYTLIIRRRLAENRGGSEADALTLPELRSGSASAFLPHLSVI